MRKNKVKYLIAILLALIVGFSNQHTVLAEEASMKSNAGISFENDYEANSTASEELPDTNSPVLVTEQEVKPAGKNLPQTGEIIGNTISWLGLMLILIVMIRSRQKKK
ncbi:LPXTG cell wall anchor domain-containing protein [Enterococcus termitis]|uniref:Gram-positive cocci surface proteins LPxTG domain-containing protein n=1 Tax=Enterococcus termitis TaxID=332950 RepID=A0A1E5G8U5_9ENTE|nr:LPXTG cell wall anchor domain-containing protein [Enterococcus termitis]OEG09126.1 hypothetical protein BCR25_11185 [Enterococcus termitis]OJG98583.1 hypothetical protein RV18_GL003006 [Enterococcus termitis]